MRGRWTWRSRTPELVVECENLDLKCGLSLPAEDKEIEQGADDGVEDAQDHGAGIMATGRGTVDVPSSSVRRPSMSRAIP